MIFAFRSLMLLFMESRGHRIYMYFFLREGWQVQFLQTDLKTPLPRTLTFKSADKLRDIFDRFSEDKMSEDKEAFNYALETGRGGVYLRLQEEQYQKLTLPPARSPRPR